MSEGKNTGIVHKLLSLPASLSSTLSSALPSVLPSLPAWLSGSSNRNNILDTRSQSSIIIDDLDTFDIILCNGQDYWFSSVIEYVTWSKFSHIGLVLKSPTWLHPSLTGNYFLESGSETFPDAVDHKLKFGVQICDLETMINNYTGTLYYRKLLSSPVKDNPQYYYDKMIQINSLIADKPYDDSVTDLVRADLRLRLGDCHRTNSFFCSALVSFIYTQLGFLPADTQWDLIEPKDFCPKYQIENIMEQVGLATLGDITRLK